MGQVKVCAVLADTYKVVSTTKTMYFLTFIFLKQTNTGRQSTWVLFPLWGTLLFACLYFIAALAYPGGSQVDKTAAGFSWTQNYWCNLLNEKAINGQPNPARPFAEMAMLVLCFTLTSFWCIFPHRVALKQTVKRTIQLSGALSMVIVLFIGTRYHDAVINVAGFFGLVATVGTLAALRKLSWRGLFWLGVFNLALVALNNILYYGHGLLFYLPAVQKISFFFFLLWICLTSVKRYRSQKTDPFIVTGDKTGHKIWPYTTAADTTKQQQQAG